MDARSRGCHPFKTVYPPLSYSGNPGAKRRISQGGAAASAARIARHRRVQEEAAARLDHPMLERTCDGFNHAVSPLLVDTPSILAVYPWATVAIQGSNDVSQREGFGCRHAVVRRVDGSPPSCCGMPLPSPPLPSL